MMYAPKNRNKKNDTFSLLLQIFHHYHHHWMSSSRPQGYCLPSDIYSRTYTFFFSKDIIYCIRLLLVQPVFLTKQILFFYVVSISFVLKILSQQLDLANNVLLLLAGHTSVYKKFSWWAQWSAVRCPLGNILSISFGTQLSCEFE